MSSVKISRFMFSLNVHVLASIPEAALKKVVYTVCVCVSTPKNFGGRDTLVKISLYFLFVFLRFSVRPGIDATLTVWVLVHALRSLFRAFKSLLASDNLQSVLLTDLL